MNLLAGDVISYEPSAVVTSGRAGHAVVEDPVGAIYDIYSGDLLPHERLTRPEIETAVVLFNLNDMIELTDDERYIWELTRPENRGDLALGFGQIRLFIRREPKPDPGIDLLHATRAAKTADRVAEQARHERDRLRGALIG